MNFATILNLSSVKSQSNSLFNSLIKSSDINDLGFKDVILKNENYLNRELDVNSNFEDSEIEKIEVNFKDKEQIIEELEQKFGDDYTREDLINVINLYLLVELANIENTPIELDSVEFIDFSNKLHDLEYDKNAIDSIMGTFTVEENKLLVPILSYKMEGYEFNLDNDKIELNNIDINEFKQDIVEFNIEKVEKIIKEFNILSSSKIEREGLKELIKEIKIKLISNKKDILRDIGINEYEASEVDRSLDLFNIIEEDKLNNLDELFNIKKIEFKAPKNTFIDIREEVSGFNKFLINQRIVNMDSGVLNLDVLNIQDRDLETLMKILTSESNSDVASLTSQNMYSFEYNINDTIKTSIVPESIRQPFMESDITQTIQYMKNANVEELTLKVNPEELGEVSINLIKNKNESDIVIVVEKEELFTSINKSLLLISNELRDSGLKINNISIEMKSNNINLNFMSNSQDDSRNSSNKENRKVKKSINRIAEGVDISTSEVSKNEVENEINLLA